MLKNIWIMPINMCMPSQVSVQLQLRFNKLREMRLSLQFKLKFDTFVVKRE